MAPIALNPGQISAAWAINGRFAAQSLTGVQRYAAEISQALDRILTDNPEMSRRLSLSLVLPSNVALPFATNAVTLRKTPFGGGHLWDQFVFPFYCSGRALSLGNFGPLSVKNHIVCIHDANTFVVPDSYSRTFGAFYRMMLPLVGRRARRIATVSEFSARMLVEHGIAAADKIFVAPNGHEHVLRWDARRGNRALLERSHRPYVLLLGSRAPHKNIGTVLAAAPALNEGGIDILVVGSRSSIFSDNNLAVEGPNIRFLGRVDDDDLALLYENALCLAFPSITEGFGLPPLEAMVCGCPVIAANTASLPEVGGDAFMYADPGKPRVWQELILTLAASNERRQFLIGEGRTRARSFSWAKSAQIYIDEMLGLSVVSRLDV